jgi:hypothetical protein
LCLANNSAFGNGPADDVFKNPSKLTPEELRVVRPINLTMNFDVAFGSPHRQM